MDSHMNIEGASKINTFKRLLSELKEDDNISSTGHRCRELDCLRAYYYLAIVHFLQDRESSSVSAISQDKKSQATSEVPEELKDQNVEPDICSTHVPEVETSVDACVVSSSSADNKSSQTDKLKSQNISSATSVTSAEVSSKISPDCKVLSMTKLYDLSKGLLWDIQAKRYALTETLGYIHKAISQCLLTDKSKEKSLPTQGVSSRPRPDILLCSKGDNSVDSNNDDSSEKKGKENQSKETDESCDLHNVDPLDAGDDIFPHSDVEMMLANGKDTAHKSRKVLWEDQPPLYLCDKHEAGTRSTSCLLNPTKYINVPDEWYSMPVDKKYFMSYVTMPVLREEQEFVTHELKRIPDSSHVPFPTTFETAKMLLKTTHICTAQDDKEVIEYSEKLVKWALNFAVTTKQRDELDTLLKSLVKESAV